MLHASAAVATVLIPSQLSQSSFGWKALLVAESPCDTEDLLSCWSQLGWDPILEAICKMRKFGEVGDAMNYSRFRQISSKLTHTILDWELAVGRESEILTFFLLLISSLVMNHLRIFLSLPSLELWTPNKTSTVLLFLAAALLTNKEEKKH